MINIFKLNDWEIKKFIIFITSIQLAVWGLLILDFLDLKIPILSEIILLFYLLVVPGTLILRVINIHELGTIETILYDIGLSIGSLMIIGFVLNFILSVFIKHPIALTPLIISMSVFVISLMIVAFFRDKNNYYSSEINLKEYSLPIILFFSLIPFFGVFSAYIMNSGLYYQNISKLLLIILIVFINLFTFFKFDKKYYPMVIFVSTLSLLYSSSLISGHIWGWDINGEYYFSNLVVQSSLWDPKISYDINAMLSIVILAPIISIVSSINLVWVFKIIYPFILALVPLGLYPLFKSQTNDKVAFLACFFFISLNSFSIELLSLGRQEIADLFLVLILILLVTNNVKKMPKSILIIFFTFSLVVSHYGLSYIYLFIIIMSLIFIVCYNKFAEFQKKKGNSIKSLENKNLINMNYTLIFLVFALSWYMYASGSSIFENILNIGSHITGSIFSEFMDPNSVQGLSMATQETNTTLRFIFKIVNYLNQIFIVIGTILLLKIKDYKFSIEFKILAFLNLLLLIMAVTVPSFSSSLNTTRLYQITLTILAPLFIIGGIKLLNVIRINYETSLKILAVYTAIIFLFSTGFVYEISNDQPSLLTLNNKIEGPIFNEKEVKGAEWISTNVKGTIYADSIRIALIKGYKYQSSERFIFTNNQIKFKNGSYLYFGTSNIIKNEFFFKKTNDHVNINYLEDAKNELYDNGGSRVYV